MVVCDAAGGRRNATVARMPGTQPGLAADGTGSCFLQAAGIAKSCVPAVPPCPSRIPDPLEDGVGAGLWCGRPACHGGEGKSWEPQVRDREMSKPRTLFDKIWDSHVVNRQEDGTCI